MVLKSIFLALCLALLAAVRANYRFDEDVAVDILCNENGIGVRLAFDEPFHGVIFPKTFDKDPACRYGSLDDNAKVSTFDLPARRCGTASKDVSKAKILSNTIIVQWDASRQTSLDKAIDIGCKLESGVKELSAKVHDRLALANPSVEASFRFFTSKAAESERAIAYLGDKVGAEIFIKDHSKQFRDARVTNCIARENNSSLVSMKLVDEVGCTTRSQLLSAFSAFASYDQEYDLIAVAEMIAFRFSDSNDVFVSCDVELCKTKCDNVCDASKRFLRRSLAEHPVHGAGKSESEISRLMQQTVDAFSSKLLPKVKKEDVILSKRSDSFETPALGEENESSVQDYLTDVGLEPVEDHEVAKLRVTASLAVLSSKGKEEIVAEDCFPKWRLTLMTFFLSLISTALVIACTFLACYVRKERKRNQLNRFLLYSYK